MDNIDTGHWSLDKDLVWNPDAFGFVYLIINKIDGRLYIGSKQMVKKITRKPLKGKKNKRHETAESDWKTYTGSCRELNEDIQKLGKNNFEFYITEWASGKMDLKYKELKKQMINNAIYSKKYYNRIVNVRLSFNGEKI